MEFFHNAGASIGKLFEGSQDEVLQRLFGSSRALDELADAFQKRGIVFSNERRSSEAPDSHTREFSILPTINGRPGPISATTFVDLFNTDHLGRYPLRSFTLYHITLTEEWYKRNNVEELYWLVRVTYSTQLI